MTNWNSMLSATIPTPCYERPFVCDGFPSESQVIVIGENPATPLSVDWWTFWNPETGFDYQSFLNHYLKERSRIGKGTSPTRMRLNRFRENGVSCVETNSFRNEKPDGVGVGSPNFGVLNLLISNMPKLWGVVAHGKVAQAFLREAHIPLEVRLRGTRHFRTESYSTIDSICEEILGGVEV